MPEINRLSQTDVVQGGDNLALYVTANGDARKMSITLLTEFMQDTLVISSGFGAYFTQYGSPSATAFNIVLTDEKDDNTNIHLILTPTS